MAPSASGLRQLAGAPKAIGLAGRRAQAENSATKLTRQLSTWPANRSSIYLAAIENLALAATDMSRVLELGSFRLIKSIQLLIGQTFVVWPVQVFWSFRRC